MVVILNIDLNNIQSLMIHKKKTDILRDLDVYEDHEVVIRAKPKRIEKGYVVQQPDFRGSRYRGVSKNKGKWQVRSSKRFISIPNLHIFTSFSLFS